MTNDAKVKARDNRRC